MSDRTQRIYSRRASLKYSLSLITGTIMSLQLHEALRLRALANSERDFSVTDEQPLKYQAGAKGILYGAATNRAELEPDGAFADQLDQHCNLVAFDGPLKWNHSSHVMRPAPNEFDLSAADYCFEFAEQRNLAVQAHNFIFHLDTPGWFQEVITPETVESVLIEHADRVIKRYAGRIHSWITVNEAIDPTHGNDRGLRDSPWREVMGDDYVERGFEIAAAADPNAMLLYNDYGLEYDNPEADAKRRDVLKLLERLKSKGIPVHGLGLQSHLQGDRFNQFNPEKYRQFLREAAQMGLHLLVTELDVIDNYLPAEIPERDRMIASIYEDYLSVVVDEPAVIAVTTFGLSDRYSWLSEHFPRPDGLPVRPLLLDDQLNRKLSWNATARAFERAQGR
jgi:endo-1,4-beta-xylanase